jgi:hypothetical protein
MLCSAGSVGPVDHKCKSISVFDFPVGFYYAV